MKSSSITVVMFLFLCGIPLVSTTLRADEIELLTGSKGIGTIISETKEDVVFEFVRTGETIQRTIPKDKIHTIEQNGKVRIITAKTGETTGNNPQTVTSPTGVSQAGTPQTGSTSPAGVPQSQNTVRTPQQVRDIIQQHGSTPPDWVASISLDFIPKTLDLSFQNAPGEWNNQKNIGQYIWDVVNPNPGRWQQGVRLMYHLLDVHKNNPQTKQKVQETLGNLYFRLFQDYPRAAFWLTQAGVPNRPTERPGLSEMVAECYWKLGSKAMAMELLDKVPLTLHRIKLYSDMGDISRALQIAEMVAWQHNRPDFVYIYAGDGCRTAGKFDQAIEYYKKVLAVPATPQRTKEMMDRNTKRAAANIIGINAFNRLDITKIPDGVYKGDSVGFAGQLYVEVSVKDKKITNVKVVSHQEKQYYSSLNDIPRQIVTRQSLTNVDAVSGATATSEAIVNAAAKALVAAQK